MTQPTVSEHWKMVVSQESSHIQYILTKTLYSTMSSETMFCLTTKKLLYKFCISLELQLQLSL